MVSGTYRGAIVSAVIGFVGSILSAYIFYLGKLTFEKLIWIVGGLILLD